jgi:hypothetical protein
MPRISSLEERSFAFQSSEPNQHNMISCNTNVWYLAELILNLPTEILNRQDLTWKLFFRFWKRAFVMGNYADKYLNIEVI